MPSPSVGRTPDSRQAATRIAIEAAVLRQQVTWLNERASATRREPSGRIDCEAREADYAALHAELDAIGVDDLGQQIARDTVSMLLISGASRLRFILEVQR